jgi:hypothetical protein
MRISRRHSGNSRERDPRSLLHRHHRRLRLHPRPQRRHHLPIFASRPTPTCSARYLKLSVHHYLNTVNMLDRLLRPRPSPRPSLRLSRSHHTRIRLPLGRNHLVVEGRKMTKSGINGRHRSQTEKEQREGDLNLRACVLVPSVQRARNPHSARRRQKRRVPDRQAPPFPR